MRRLLLLCAAATLASACTGFRLPVLGASRAELREERGQLVGFGTGEGRSDDLRAACALAQREAKSTGLQQLVSAGLRPTRRPVVRERLVDPAGRCRVKLAWSNLKPARSAPSSAAAARAQVRSVVVVPAMQTPGGAARVAPVDPSAPVAPPPPALGDGPAPTPPPVAVAPTAAAPQVQPIIYIDLRGGHAPPPQLHGAAPAAAPVATITRGAEPAPAAAEPRRFGLGAGFAIGPFDDEPALEVLASWRVYRAMSDRLTADVNAVGTFLPQLSTPGVGARAEVAVLFHPLELPLITPFVGASAGARLLLADGGALEDGYALAVEPALVAGSTLRSLGVETRATLSMPLSFAGRDLDPTFTGALLYRF
ncbi:MAG: hypothetical protein ACK4N5_22425 [Myxococcales bacterium]